MLLHKFDGNFTRERFLDMDDWELQNVLCRPNLHHGDDTRSYWPVGREDQDDPVVKVGISKRAVFFTPPRVEAYKLLGLTQEECEARFQEWCRKLGWKEK